MTIYRIPAIAYQPEQLVEARNVAQARALIAGGLIEPIVATAHEVHRLALAGAPIISATTAEVSQAARPETPAEDDRPLVHGNTNRFTETV